jgi:hypothetical protein
MPVLDALFFAQASAALVATGLGSAAEAGESDHEVGWWSGAPSTLSLIIRRAERSED